MQRPWLPEDVGILLLTLFLGSYSAFLAGECLGLWHLLPWPCGQVTRGQGP